MHLSICIVNWNTREDLRRCLVSLPAGSQETPLEVFVVDNASTDGSAKMVEQEFPDVHLIRNPRNSGFAHANNLAIHSSSGDFVLLLNPDTIVHPRAFDILISKMQSRPDVGIAGPKLLNADGSLQYSCRRFPTFSTGLFRNSLLGRLMPGNVQVKDYLMTDFDHASVTEVDWVSGAALCIRREVIGKIGVLDEDFFMYCEDVDWCYRARQAGWRVLYIPDAVITHIIGRSSDQAVEQMVRAHHCSMGIYYRKHYREKTPWLLRPLAPLGIWLRQQMVLREKRRERAKK